MDIIPMNTMHLRAVIAVAVACAIAGATHCSAKPMDVEAGQDAVTVSDIVKRPLAKRQLTSDETARYTGLAESDNADRQLVAVPALAWSRDAKSKAVLKRLAGSAKPDIVGGAAAYALLVRARGAGSANALFKALSARLACSPDPFERMFVANRLAVDFHGQAFEPILAAARKETDKTVKCDMLYYLTDIGDARGAEESLDLQWPEASWSLPENLSYIMGAITPNRPKDELGNSCGTLVEKLRHKAQAGADLQSRWEK